MTGTDELRALVESYLGELALTPELGGQAESVRYSIEVGGQVNRDAAWFYPEPKPGFEQLEGHLAFYARRVDAAHLDVELVTPQPGAYYGGWITEEIEGPFKGDPGSEGW